jgi:putative tryptophan/tyrosine transport system substrate-binding protein
MQRRSFITLLGGAAAAAAPARLHTGPALGAERVQRVGLFFNQTADDPASQVRIAVFVQKLQELGWTVGRNLRIEFRWSAGNANLLRKHAEELVALAPDVILASGGSTVAPLQQVSRTVPIVFVTVTDPVAGGFVETLARPASNATGFTFFEYAFGGKWLELLKQIAPRVARVAVLRNLNLASGSGQLGAIQTVAPSFGVEVTPVDLRDAAEIERAVGAFARGPNGGMIVTSSTFAGINTETILGLAARHGLPAVYSNRGYVDRGGLISYGVDSIDQFRLAAGYVDRILKGEKPASRRISGRPRAHGATPLEELAQRAGACARVRTRPGR